MKRIYIIFLALAVLVAPAKTQTTFPTEFANNAVAVTATNQFLNFGFDASVVTIVNDGTNEIFFSFSLVATTSKFKLNSGESWSGEVPSPSRGVALICSSAETATVRVGAWR